MVNAPIGIEAQESVDEAMSVPEDMGAQEPRTKAPRVANEAMSVPEDIGAQTPHATMQVLIAGNWCRAGQPAMPLLLVQVNGSLQVVSKPPWNSVDRAHGGWDILHQTDNTLKMIMIWHYTSTNDPGMKAKTMLEVTGTLWQEKYNKKESFEIFHVNPTSRWHSLLIPRIMPQAKPIPEMQSMGGSRAFHSLIPNALHSIITWLHPGKEPSYLALYRDSIGVSFYQGHGQWTLPHGRWLFAGEQLAVHFHHKGALDDKGYPASPFTALGPIKIPKELEHLTRIDTPCKILRAIGGSEQSDGPAILLENAPATMMSWHILVQWVHFADH